MEERSDGSDGPPKPQNSVLGWLADVTFDAFADLYTATVPQHPQVQATASTRQEALAGVLLDRAEISPL